MDAQKRFRESIARAGLTPPDEVIADGELHRFASNGKRGDSAGWYVLHLDGIPAGIFGDWRTGLSENWRAQTGKALSHAERARLREQHEAARRKREQAERALREDAQRRAANSWSEGTPATGQHPYLVRKRVPPHGLKVDDGGQLMVPMRDSTGVLHSLQFIPPDGVQKRFIFGGRKVGCYFAIGKPNGSVAIAEGFATGASIHDATGIAVAVAFDCGNLEPVARAIRGKLPDARIILCADDDINTDGNPGLTRATQAARAIGGLVAIPDFGANRPAGATDFNDLAATRGAEAVRACIESAKALDGEQWPEPLPLTSEQLIEPYPIDALPGMIGAAVREVANFVQCPIALAACSALSALSVAAQGLANVRRGADLIGPVSLYILAVAESGERKSECDRRFSESLQAWQQAETERIKPDLAKYRASLATWEAEHEACRNAVKQARKNGESIEDARRALEDLEANKPAAVKVPHICRESETAESLAWNMAKPDGWPSAGILSSEAGVVFGGHSMRRDTIMQSLALLNKFWSGEGFRVGRRTSEQYEAIGVRLTMGLAVQPETVQAFFEDAKGLARGTGFAARFLIAWPESTQGKRPYRDSASNWRGLTAYERRLRELLDKPLTLGSLGQLEPPALEMSGEAFATWRHFHDGTEAELATGGELAELRDVASKAAENVARVAALFHLFEHGPKEEIQAAHVAMAARIVTWHVFEARRFLGGISMPKPLSNAIRLDAWLIAQCRKTGTDKIQTREVMRLGPNPTRRKPDLLAALAELAETYRARQSDDGRFIVVSPLVLEAGNGHT